MPDTGHKESSGRSTGSGQRRGRSRPKGRQVDTDALAEVQALLGDAPRRRDLLIEHLHRIQDATGRLAKPHLAALAAEMRLSMAEVYEVATFYHHFDIADAPAPKLTIRVCDSLSCALAGADALLHEVRARVGADVRVVPAPCLGACHRAPAVHVGKALIAPAMPEAVAIAATTGTIAPVAASPRRLAAYRAEGGYALLADCLAGKRTADEIQTLMSASGLRGLGGAGFPAGQKWKLVRGFPGPRLMAVNADEGEPGTFKDRMFLETDPHRMIEGMLIAAWAVEAADIYVYVRDEYPEARGVLADELAALETAGLLGGTRVHLRRGAGAYICGEESAMIESIEGKRGLPRHKPPYPAEVGLFGRPTLAHNVETLYWIRDIVERGPDWYANQGRRGRKGFRAFSVSGRVKEPGVKIAPAGVTVRELIEEFSGGMAPGHSFKAYLPGGASGGILPASMGDLPLDFGTLEPHGCFVGSGAVVVLSDKDSMRDAALNLMRFFAHESCGQCTPCRVGTEKAVALMAQPRWDRPLLNELSEAMTDASICGLGQAAPNPVRSVMKHFPEELA